MRRLGLGWSKKTERDFTTLRDEPAARTPDEPWTDPDQVWPAADDRAPSAAPPVESPAPEDDVGDPPQERFASTPAAPRDTRSIFEPSPRETRMLGSSQPETHDTCIGSGSHITGTLAFEGTVRIDGTVDGEIVAQESAVISETAVVTARITADSVVVTGKVTGDVTASRRLEIRAPGELHGNVSTPSLIIHDGAIFEGQCSMARAAGKGLPKHPESSTNGGGYDSSSPFA
jgi:cytoskeletal protein CcmA (bactofilin family)